MSENTTPKQRRSARSRPDPRNPLVLDTRDLGRAPGAMREVQRSFLTPAAIGLDIVQVPQGAPVVLDLKMESVTEGVLVTGSATAPTEGECGRCLDEIQGEITAQIVELYAYPASITDETADKDEVHRIEGDLIDLEPVVRDTIVLGLPGTPLCQPDCAGLCPDCGQRLDDLPADHAHEVIDPRWAALAALAGEVADDDQTTGLGNSAETRTKE